MTPARQPHSQRCKIPLDVCDRCELEWIDCGLDARECQKEMAEGKQHNPHTSPSAPAPDDGTPMSPDSDYFVLKLNSKDKWHRDASIAAINIYADTVESVMPQLASDIRKKYPRSRPAPPAPEQCSQKDDERVPACRYSFCERPEICDRLMKIHDDDIRVETAKVECKRVLDALEAYRKSAEIKAPEKGDYLYPGRAEKRDMLHTFGIWIESLRAQQEEQENK